MKGRLLILNIILLTACIDNDTIPEDVIKKHKMANILVDFHLLESKIEQLDIEPDSAAEVYDHFEDLIFEQHNVDSLIYRESLLFYLDHPHIMNDIYIEVVDTLMVRERAKRIN